MATVETRNRATSSEESRRTSPSGSKKGRVRAPLVHRPGGAPEELCDHAGRARGALDDGMGFDGSSITGSNAIEESDMVAIPDPETFQLMPWREGERKVARMINDVVTPDGQPYEGVRGTCSDGRSSG